MIVHAILIAHVFMHSEQKKIVHNSPFYKIDDMYLNLPYWKSNGWVIYLLIAAI